VHIVTANAGFVEHATSDTTTLEHFDNAFGINVRGGFFTVQKAFPLMKDGGSILLVSSGLPMKGFQAHDVYAVTKTAMRPSAAAGSRSICGI
jgi:NAD(P)-dependent dehydrogenase (short-subunit alcohol dehydrogenase family)